MEQKRRPLWPWFIGALGVLILAGVLFWKPVCLQLMSAMTEQEFSHNYRRDASWVMIVANEDWAIQFGGSAGLPRLERLMHDDSLSVQGRKTAAMIREMIINKRHLTLLGYPVLPRQSWLMESMKAYIRERDSRP